MTHIFSKITSVINIIVCDLDNSFLTQEIRNVFGDQGENKHKNQYLMKKKIYLHVFPDTV